MLLHTVNKAPSRPELDTCIRFMASRDAIVLIEDGVYAALRGGENKLAPLLDAGNPVYAVKADVEARGLANRLVEGVQVVDYPGFVSLCARYSRVKSWF